MSAPVRKDVIEQPSKEKKEFARKKIKLRANHFKVNIETRQLWQYRIDWSAPESGSAPALKTKEERRAAFNSFVEQYIHGYSLYFHKSPRIQNRYLF